MIAVNRMMRDCPRPILAGATHHPVQAMAWVPDGVPVYSPQALGAATHLLAPTPAWHGTSALLAVEVARFLGFGRILLAGVPMDGGAHYHDSGTLAPHLEYYRQGWLNAAADIRPHVRSLSGWTRDLFGFPGPEWLEAP